MMDVIRSLVVLMTGALCGFVVLILLYVSAQPDTIEGGYLHKLTPQQYEVLQTCKELHNGNKPETQKCFLVLVGYRVSSIYL